MMARSAQALSDLPAARGLPGRHALLLCRLRGIAWHWFVMLALWVSFCVAHGSAGASPAALVLRDDVPSVDAWAAVTALADEDARLSVQEAAARAASFRPPEGKRGTLGVRSGAMWLRIPITVAGSSDGAWIVDVDYPVLNHLDVYLLQGPQVLQQAKLGSLQPFSQRPLHSRTHALALSVQPGQAYELLLRAQTGGAMVLPVTLAKTTAWHSAALNEQMLQGLVTGLALCLLIYSLAQWLVLREVLFIQYALLLSGSLLFSLHFFGLGAQYLWQDNPWFEQHAAGLSALMATGGSFLFIGQALSSDLSQSRVLRAMRWGALLCGVLAFVHALDLLSIRAVTAVVSILGLVPALMGIPGAVRRARQGDPVGSSLLLAWVVYFGATATVIGVIRGWVPANFWTLHSFEFGAVVDMLLFLRVLGLRTQALRLEALDAHRERDAMRSLAHTDPLTGLLNRRGLNLALAPALQRCGPGKLVAVYVMDLDGFKPVNDRHGHDVGDELLVAVTRRLQRTVRQSDVVARLGGDEFVVMAGHLAAEEQAEELGHKLLGAFRSPFSLGDVQVDVGLTVGYAIAPDDSHDAVGLLKLADAAMYSGKQGGKFCLRRNTGDLALSSS